jgi:hypothetical protein
MDHYVFYKCNESCTSCHHIHYSFNLIVPVKFGKMGSRYIVINKTSYLSCLEFVEFISISFSPCAFLLSDYSQSQSYVKIFVLSMAPIVRIKPLGLEILEAYEKHLALFQRVMWFEFIRSF